MRKIDKPTVFTEHIDICRNCRGLGSIKDETQRYSHITCEVCDGKGRVLVKKEIRITIETI